MGGVGGSLGGWGLKVLIMGMGTINHTYNKSYNSAYVLLKKRIKCIYNYLFIVIYL